MKTFEELIRAFINHIWNIILKLTTPKVMEIKRGIIRKPNPNIRTYFDLYKYKWDRNDILIITTALKNDTKSKNNINLALALNYYNYNVKIITCSVDNKYWELEIPKLRIERIRTSFPNSFFGRFESPFRFLNSIILAIWTVFNYTFGKGGRNIVCDTSRVSIPLLKLTGRFRVTYMQYFETFETQPDFIFFPDLAMKMVDQIIVQNRISKCLFSNYYSTNKWARTLYPCVDTGKLYMEECVPIKEIIPNIPNNVFLFVTFGCFDKNSNFELTIDAFNSLYDRLIQQGSKEKIRLVIARNAEYFIEEEILYYNHIRNYASGTKCASRILFFKQLPTISKKSLITYCTAVIYTQIEDKDGFDIIEAFYIGRPVIATENSLSFEYVTPESGFLVQPNVEFVTDCMEEVVVKYVQAEQLGANARKYFYERFSFCTYAKKVNQLLGDGSHICEISN